MADPPELPAALSPAAASHDAGAAGLLRGDADALRGRLEALGEALTGDRTRWEERPFVRSELPWEQGLAATSTFLRGLGWDAIETLEADPWRVQGPRWGAPSELRDLAARLETLTAVARFAGRPGGGAGVRAQDAGARDADAEMARWRRVKGRKRRQIEVFAAALGGVLPGLPARDAPPRVVDWCAGKAHLGRTLALDWGGELLALERDPALCAAGRAEAAERGVASRHEAVDVLEPAEVARCWRGRPEDVAVALHACGDLGGRLLADASDRGVSTVALAPCCHHKVAPRPGADRGVYAPTSPEGRANDPRLGPPGLRAATADEQVAPPRRRERRRREVAFRQGLDLLVREASGVDAYTPLGPVPRAQLDGPFDAFCAAVAEAHGLPLPARFDPARAEAAGWERARTVRALGLMRGLHRRVLELWVVLDRALGQVARGRRARVGTFCGPQLTPRNLLIVSTLDAARPRAAPGTSAT